MLKKIGFHILFCFASTLSINAQIIQLQTPSLTGRNAKCYYFEGSRTDSLETVIGNSGRATFMIPNENYRGMAAVTIFNAGGIEIAVDEPFILIDCNENDFNHETVVFPQSNENNFLKKIFTTRNKYVQQKGWLQAGEHIFPNSPLLSHLQPEIEKIDLAMQMLDKEIEASDLYISKYYQLGNFMNRLVEAEHNGDTKMAKLIRQEMEDSLDITSLYTSGRLWNDAFSYYIRLFDYTENNDTKQKQYAQSVLKTSQRLTSPYFEAFLDANVKETEYFGWLDAQHLIIEGLLTKYKGFSSSYPNLQRAIGTYYLKINKSLPPIVGLADSSENYDKLLIAFHDSDCSSCINEMTRLMQIYPTLKEKGIRVVSIAADINKDRFEAETSRFQWKDKLCDYKGFTGVNFSNYNVMATPSFYLTDKKGKLLGNYFSIMDLERNL
ncbi:thioredoxin family protein [Dysgonomonas sp. Marseille-P4677]|uniref:peroxiredoxin family protein n=1 Tax=Dysgonomonas sp. Marseille-P4677 TaxID=2364790 RepID=UPI001911C8DD|nr:thioredoxin-like domain-containing protein [Dysgonomonas sp. Marseille-P4677]MBK5721290.1 thioredoxin family protein [Dysgonomonas sp. Marseille-P4677]